MEVSKRIVQYCESKGIRQADLLAFKIASKQTINYVWHGTHKPNCEFLEKIASTYKDLNLRWLLTGEGEMIIAEKESSDAIVLYLESCIEKKDKEIEKLNREIGSLIKKNGNTLKSK